MEVPSVGVAWVAIVAASIAQVRMNDDRILDGTALRIQASPVAPGREPVGGVTVPLEVPLSGRGRRFKAAVSRATRIWITLLEVVAVN